MSPSPPAPSTFKFYKSANHLSTQSSSTNRSPPSPNSDANSSVAIEMTAVAQRQDPIRQHQYSPRVSVTRSPSASSPAGHRTSPYQRPIATLPKQHSRSPLPGPVDEARSRDPLPRISLPSNPRSSLAMGSLTSTRPEDDPERGVSIPPMSSLGLQTPATISPERDHGRKESPYNPGRGTTLPALSTMEDKVKPSESPAKTGLKRSRSPPPGESDHTPRLHPDLDRTSPRGYPISQLRPSFAPYDSVERLPQTHNELRNGSRHISESSLSAQHPYSRLSPPWTRDPERERMIAREREREYERARRAELEYRTPQSPHPHSYYDRYRRGYEGHGALGHGHPHGYSEPLSEPSSPPLRALPPDYHATAPPPHHAYYQDRLASGRNRSHSAATAPTRGHAAADAHAALNATGQNRRIAHLMSEQKRRESINSGFTALRGVLPSSIPTDSKAVVLRKAVAHIVALESRLRKAGVDVGTTGARSGSPLAPSWKEYEMDEEGSTPYDEKARESEGRTSGEPSPYKPSSRSRSDQDEREEVDSEQESGSEAGTEDVEMKEVKEKDRETNWRGPPPRSGGRGDRVVVKRERWDEREHLGLGESFERGGA